jgi:cell division protein FtsB
MRRAVRVLLVAVVVGGIVFLFVLPGRTWLAQARAHAVAERQAAALSRENAALAERIAQLQSSAYVEQLAREEFGLVRPGEQAYGILLPAASTTTTTTTTASTTTASTTTTTATRTATNTATTPAPTRPTTPRQR